MTTPYPIPSFIANAGVTQKKYKLWLDRKAMTHAIRDSERWDVEITVEDYRKAIHKAVEDSKGLDEYTKEPLSWDLIGTYVNDDSKLEGIAYRKRFEFLPSVDHVDANATTATFKICGLRTNDCKSHLTIEELKTFAQKILNHN